MGEHSDLASLSPWGNTLTLLFYHHGEHSGLAPSKAPMEVRCWDVVLDAPEVSILHLPALLCIHEDSHQLP